MNTHSPDITVAILAVQGAFAEHEKMLQKIGIQTIQLRNKKDLQNHFDGIILPGGESTVQGKLLEELDMLLPLKEKFQKGLPVLATCAGLILLAETISNDSHIYFGTLPVTVKRNAYGRQLSSFSCEGTVDTIEHFPMEFIRAPYVVKANSKVQILSTVNDKIVAVRSGNQIGLSFHPELTDDLRIHHMFLRLIDDFT